MEVRDETPPDSGRRREGGSTHRQHLSVRNFGHQAAITAALDAVSGDAVVVMDADLQDEPSRFPGFSRYMRKATMSSSRSGERGKRA